MAPGTCGLLFHSNVVWLSPMLIYAATLFPFLDCPSAKQQTLMMGYKALAVSVTPDCYFTLATLKQY